MIFNICKVSSSGEAVRSRKKAAGRESLPREMQRRGRCREEASRQKPGRGVLGPFTCSHSGLEAKLQQMGFPFLSGLKGVLYSVRSSEICLVTPGQPRRVSRKTGDT